MKWFIIVLFFTMPVTAGTLVDHDQDGLFCVQEDKGLFCGEDDQDKCDFIPNTSRDDGHCSVDVNGDGVFTIADIRQVQSVNDHKLGSGFGGNICFYMIRVTEYNRRLTLAGLPLLQRDLPFMVVGAGAHCYGHHTYPPIP